MCEKHTTGVGPFANQQEITETALNLLETGPLELQKEADCYLYLLPQLPAEIAKFLIQIEVSGFTTQVLSPNGKSDLITLNKKTLLLAKPESGVDSWIHPELRDYLHYLYAPSGFIPPYFEIGYRLFNEGDHEHAGKVQIVFYAHKETVETYGLTEQGKPNVSWAEKSNCCNKKARRKVAPVAQQLSPEQLKALPQTLSGDVLYRFIPLDDETLQASFAAEDEHYIEHLQKNNGDSVKITMKSNKGEDVPIHLAYPNACYIHPLIREAMQDADKPSVNLFRETYTWGFVNTDEFKGILFVCLAPEVNYLPANGACNIYKPQLPPILQNGSLAKKRCPACKS